MAFKTILLTLLVGLVLGSGGYQGAVAGVAGNAIGPFVGGGAYVLRVPLKTIDRCELRCFQMRCRRLRRRLQSGAAPRGQRLSGNPGAHQPEGVPVRERTDR